MVEAYGELPDSVSRARRLQRLVASALLMGAAAMTSGAGTLALLASGALAAHRRRQQMEIDLAKSLTV